MEQFISEVLGRVKRHLENRSTEVAPEPSRKNSEYYQSLDQFQKESKNVFRRMPLPVAFSAELPKAGSWITREDFNIPLLITRSSEGKVGAFSNRCRHRGSVLTTERVGNGNCFTCPYHSWTYSSDGKLIGIPHQKGFSHVNTSSMGLKPYPVMEAHGMIWLRYEAQDCQGIESGSTVGFSAEVERFLEPIAKDLSFYRLNQATLLDVSEEECSANWKILTEAFLEGYHIQTTHRKTFAAGVFDNFSIYDTLGMHSRAFYPLKKIQRLFEMPEISPAKAMSCLSGIYHFFPNTILAIEPFQLSCVQFIPKSTNKTLARLTTLSHSNGALDPVRFEKERKLLRAGVLEDFQVAEGIQSNLNSGQIFDFQFGLYEGLITHFHQMLDQCL